MEEGLPPRRKGTKKKEVAKLAKLTSMVRSKLQAPLKTNSRLMQFLVSWCLGG
jgi:hypothetical protein